MSREAAGYYFPGFLQGKYRQDLKYLYHKMGSKFVRLQKHESLVISSVHKETDSARQNPEHKSFKTKYGKEILFTPDSILITNNQGMMVEMNDAEGITITSDKDIAIQAEGDMTIASGSDSLLVAAENTVQVKQGSTTMTLSDDIYFTDGSSSSSSAICAMVLPLKIFFLPFIFLHYTVFLSGTRQKSCFSHEKLFT